MAFSRFQFRLSTLLWITLAVACFFGGMMVERWRDDRELANFLRLWREKPLTYHGGPRGEEAAR